MYWITSRMATAVLCAFVASAALAEFRVTTWNVKHLGRRNFDTFLAAQALAQSDLVVLQEVNTSESGAIALRALADRLGAQESAKFCIALSEIPTDGKERYGALWREDKFSYMTTNGVLVAECPQFAITLRLGAEGADKIIREPAVGRFQEKDTGKRFWIATIHTVPKSKNPAQEIPHVFAAALAVAGKRPLIVAGDFNLSCAHEAFRGAAEIGFMAAIPCTQPTSLKMRSRELNEPYDNILVKGADVTKGSVANLYQLFPQIEQTQVYNALSDHSPVSATIILSE